MENSAPYLQFFIAGAFAFISLYLLVIAFVMRSEKAVSKIFARIGLVGIFFAFVTGVFPPLAILIAIGAIVLLVIWGVNQALF